MALRSSMKVGKLASKAGKIANEADEIGKWKQMGLIADQNVNAYSQLGGEYEKTTALLRKQEVALTRYESMKARAQRAANGELSWGTPVEKVQHEFDKRFAQSYNAAIGQAGNGDIKGKFHALHDELWKNDTIGDILGNMPDEAAGPGIYAYLMGRNNPALAAKASQKFGKLSDKDKLWHYIKGNPARSVCLKHRLLPDNRVWSLWVKHREDAVVIPRNGIHTERVNLEGIRNRLESVAKNNLFSELCGCGRGASVYVNR
jgi:hypothetical protein